MHITYTLPFALQEARAAASIDAGSWDSLPGTPLWMTPGDGFSKCHILVWWKYRNQIEAVQATARNKEYKRNQKRGK